MKKKICVIITIIILAILVFGGFFLWQSQFSLSIGESKIDKEEFLDAAAGKMYEVTEYFSGKSGGAMDAGFWEREIEGEFPYKKLADAALEELKYFHAVYDLAKENGYVEDASYQGFKARWEAENQYRKEQIAKGGAVYGLSEYTLELYREYEMDTLQKQYCEDLDNEGMVITDADREQYYTEHAVSYQREDDRVLDYVKIPYAGEMDEEQAKGLKDILTAVYKKLDKDTTLAETAGAEKAIVPYLEHAEVTADELNMYSRSIGDVLEYAWNLQAGESTAVLDENGCFYLIECTDRKANEPTPMEEIKDNINKTLREENYDKIVAERAEKAEVEGDMERIYFFMKKNINN